MQGKVQRPHEDLDKATCAGVSAMSGNTEWFPAVALPEAHTGTQRVAGDPCQCWVRADLSGKKKEIGLLKSLGEKNVPSPRGTKGLARLLQGK